MASSVQEIMNAMKKDSDEFFKEMDTFLKKEREYQKRLSEIRAEREKENVK